MQALRETLLAWYAENGRSHLPWRGSRDPYCIIVSEFMLQQTQVERVIPAYESFVARFGSFRALAAAERADVVRAWKGLGYNLRAVRLHELAKTVVERHDGVLPSDVAALRKLPGIGGYTVAAVRAFAFETDDVAIDVNVRRIVHRLRFGFEYPPKANAIEIDSTARALLARGRAHDWNSALMDLGATTCTARAPKCRSCPLQPWCAAAPLSAETVAEAAREHLQSKRRGPQAVLPFEQTRRYARGRVLDRLREVQPGSKLSEHELETLLAGNGALQRYPLREILAGLERDGFVNRDDSGISLR
ncbi:MAG: A/G-specific adenine glycosylase [Candidatus Eremiobacteraeota bacterium]|nr:A/G-specific adenine glycosylase [Candidatus Eremiobacteraeota bacterium]